MKANLSITAKLKYTTVALLTLLVLGNTGYAQLCTGSLGDPVVHIDFGSGSGRGPALGSAITSYTYSSSGMPMDGYYTIANTTAGMLNSWWTTTDHTGNANGYMMVVNASAGAGVFYTKKVTGLCQGTTYEFAAWVMNLFNVTYNPNPDLTFNISNTSGTVLNSYRTGDITATASAVVWKQVGFYFTTGSETDVVITIVNNAPGAIPGNDLLLDDITFRPCGPTVTASINGSGVSKTICKGDPAVFTLNSTISTGYTNPSYQWQVSTDGGTNWTDIPGATATTYTRLPTDSGQYLYRLSAAQGTNISSSSCRIASNILTITVNDKPVINASSNQPSCYGDTLNLSAAGGAQYTFSWTGPGNFSSAAQQPVINGITATNNGIYRITVTTPAGCTNTDSVYINVNSSPSVNAGNDVAICEGSSATLSGSGSAGSFTWTPAASLSDANITNPVASPSDTTAYILTVSNGQCKATDTVNVFVWKKPTANAGPNKMIYEGDATLLNASATGTNISYSWSPNYNINNTSILNPLVKPQDDTTYTLTVNSRFGCGIATDNVFVRVYKKISIPNAFSPNNDGINDTWKIDKLITYPDADVSVFNRYGQLLYHSKGYTTEWNGTFKGALLPVGTYYYVIDLKTVLGNHFSGWVMILR
jgi:gliding motility-associated-like protein